MSAERRIASLERKLAKQIALAQRWKNEAGTHAARARILREELTVAEKRLADRDKGSAKLLHQLQVQGAALDGYREAAVTTTPTVLTLGNPQ